MYEKNTALLMARESAPFDHSEAMRAMQSEELESKRARIVQRMMNDELAAFEAIPLWNGDVPGFRPNIPEQENPPRIVFFPPEGKGPTGVVIVSPGGGYNCKVPAIEGYPIIRHLVRAGIAAVLLDYRVKPYTQYVSLLDIQRAVRYVRANAAALNILPDKIAVHGSSAGGHLSCMAAVHYDMGDPQAADPVERVSCRPDAAVISYGVFSSAAYPRVGDFINFDQENVDLDIRNGEGLVTPYVDAQRHRVFFSAERHVTPDTPPFFCWQTCDQDDPRQLFTLGNALADCGVRFEMHIFPFGRHGLGTAADDPHIGHWPHLATEWLTKYYGFDGGAQA